MKTLADISQEITAKSTALKALYTTPERGEDWPNQVDAALKELESLRAERTPLAEAEKQKQHEAEMEAKVGMLLEWAEGVDPSARVELERALDVKDAEADEAAKGFVEEIMESDAVKAYRHGGDTGWVSTKTSLKALFDTSDFEPFSPRLPRIVPIVHRPMQLLDRINQVAYPGIQVVHWMEETLFTLPPNRGATAEGGIYQEMASSFTPRQTTMAKKTAWLPVTEETFLYSGEVANYLQRRVPTALGLRVDEGIVNDPGTTNTMNGLLSLTNRRQRNKPADESFYEAIAWMIDEVNNSQYSNADMILMHGSDYTKFMMTQDAELRYLFGLLSERRASPWGMMVHETNALARGTVIVGDFAQFFEIRDAQMMRTRIGPRNAVQTTVTVTVDDGAGSAGARPGTGTGIGYEAPAGQQMIASEVFLQTVCYRQQAFCTGTGF